MTDHSRNRSLPAGRSGLSDPPLSARQEPLQDFIQAIGHSKWLVAFAAAIGLLVTIYLLSKQPGRYYAQASVQLTDARAAVSGATQSYPNMGIGAWIDPVRTRIEVLRSRAVAEAAVNASDLRLRMLTSGATKELLGDVRIVPGQPADTLTLGFNNAGFTVSSVLGDTAAPYNTPVTVGGVTMTWTGRPAVNTARVAVLPFEEAVQIVMDNLSAAPRAATAIVDVKYIDPDPAGARRGVNAIALAFKQNNAESVRQMSQRRRVFLESQLIQTDSGLSEAELRLAEFRRGLESYSAQKSFETEQVELAGLKTQRDSLLREQALYQSMLQALSNGPNDRARNPYLTSGELRPAVAALYTQLSTDQRALDSLTTGPYARTARHPDVVRVTARKAATEQELERALRSHLAGLATLIAGVNTERQRSTSTLSSLPDAQTSEMQLSREVESFRRAEERLRDELQAARVAEAVEAGEVEVLDLALSALGPIGPNRPRTLAFGILIGLMLGSFAALLRHRLNTSIRRPEQVDPLLMGGGGLVVIPSFSESPYQVVRAMLPTRLARLTNGSAHTLASLNTTSNGAEAYRRLMTSITFSAESESIRILAVCSPSPGEGKTTTSANLAVTYAQHGRRVLLVDADLRRGCIHELLGVDRTPGLADLLHAEDAVVPAQPTKVPGLFVMPRGSAAVHPLDLIGSPRLQALFDEWSRDYDMVLIDTPAMFYAAESSLIAARAGGVIIVLRAGATQRTSIMNAWQQIHDLGGHVLRVVLNDPDAQVAAEPRYGYGAYPYAAHD